ncbi:Ribosomal RNA-processing protein [Lachnellula willkommii]|uniref:Ribosomal RNA-processing protein n=1 Tax=Lachnellula willkommii TaxID=215461 RepID=A0A559MBV9_9HELO|nr:Ribosomal RNA-processing protein [Lachnellula willkommii]
MPIVEPKIFLPPRPKRTILSSGPPSKKRKTVHKIEEISFDNDARADYLTGFHKRKVARATRAREEAEKKEKEERVRIRAQLREERKQELDEHIEAVNRALKEVRDPGVEREESDDDTWEGIADDVVEVEVVDREEEYVDEDRYTTVTVEAVDISKEGFTKSGVEDSSDEEKGAPKLVEEEKTKKVWPKKAPKKKFRYESKAERKFTRGKQKAGNKAKADARRGT